MATETSSNAEGKETIRVKPADLAKCKIEPGQTLLIQGDVLAEHFKTKGFVELHLPRRQ